METRENVFGLRRIVLFQPSELGVYAKPVVGGFAPVSPATILRDADALAALNGPMFGVCGGQHLPPGNAEYAVSVCDVLEYRHQDGNVFSPGSHPNRGLTFSILDGAVSVLDGNAIVPNAKVAIQTYPQLVENGRSVAGMSPNLERVWRSGLALMSDGRLAFAAGQMSMPAFADALVAAGARWAGYTDGGGSTALVTADGRAGSSEGRPVPSWLVVRKPSNAGWWIAGGLALAAAWFLWG